MSTYNDQVKEYVSRFQKEVGNVGLVDTHEAAAWAYEKGLMKPNLKSIVDLIAMDIAQVFREQYRTDRRGRRYRAMHAVKEKVGNKTRSLWGDMDNPKAPRPHFIKSFAQRRNQVVGDCVQLKTDIDVYNDKNPKDDPINLVLDFTRDVSELQKRPEPDAA